MDFNNFAMNKVIVMVRTSTEAQSTADQKKEMEEFCHSEGWKNIVWVEKQGASAAKVDDDYRAMIDEVKRNVEEDKDIKCFAVWHLNRLARTEEVWVEIKTFFVSHKVQIICKNPYLKLLTPSGDVDQGMELAMGLLAILSKQDQTERKAKFERAKKSMASKGQYIGGHTIPYGYYVDTDGYFQEKTEEATIIRQIFQLYATGKYSTYTLSKELEERGTTITDRKICRILKCEAYTGKEVEGKYTFKYPPIITQELFEAALQVRNANRLEMKRGKRLCLGSKLVRCFKCGAVCTSNSKHYVCCKHAHRGPCDNGYAIRQSVVDSLLWRIAELMHIDYLTNMNADKEKEYEKELLLLLQKVNAAKEKIEKSEAKKARIADNYEVGLIDRETRNLRLLKVKDEVEHQRDIINSLQGKIDAITGLLEGIDKDQDLIDAVADAAILEYTEQEKYDIIHKYIVSLTAKPVSFGERDPRTHRPNGVEILITTITNKTWKYMYVPKFYRGYNLYAWNGRRWVGDTT